MTGEERAEQWERRKTAPLDEVDARAALQQAYLETEARFFPHRDLETALSDFQDRALFLVFSSWRCFGGMDEDSLVRRILLLLPDGYEVVRTDRKGPPAESDMARILRYFNTVAITARDVLDGGRVPEANWAEEYLGDLERKGLSITESFASLGQAFEVARKAWLTFVRAVRKRTGVPGPKTPGHPSKPQRWFAASVANHLRKSDPPWTETQLSYLFAALGAEAFSNARAVHNLLVNGPGGSRTPRIRRK